MTGRNYNARMTDKQRFTLTIREVATGPCPGRAYILTGRAGPKIVEGKTGRAEIVSGRAGP